MVCQTRSSLLILFAVCLSSLVCGVLSCSGGAYTTVSTTAEANCEGSTVSTWFYNLGEDTCPAGNKTCTTDELLSCTSCGIPSAGTGYVRLVFYSDDSCKTLRTTQQGSPLQAVIIQPNVCASGLQVDYTSKNGSLTIIPSSKGNCQDAPESATVVKPGACSALPPDYFEDGVQAYVIGALPPKKPSNNGLGDGAIAGIVIGATVVVLALLFAVYKFVTRKKNDYEQF